MKKLNHKVTKTQSNTKHFVNLRALLPSWFTISLMLIVMVAHDNFAQENKRHRVIVLTDIEADPDDTQSPTDKL
jgi:predicted hotdog family 3-hydroxylacyl-ACP dehydratase